MVNGAEFGENTGSMVPVNRENEYWVAELEGRKIGLMSVKTRIIALLFVLASTAVVGYFTLTPTRVIALDENNCLSCHSNLNIKKNNKEGTAVSLRISEKDVNMGAHRYIDCTTCHTTKPHEVKPELTKSSSAAKCGTCHQYEYKVHTQSIHGQQLMQGNRDVATCVDCHSPKGDAHSVIRVLEYGAPTYKKNIAETCNNCHGNEELMGSYGIVEKVYESYMRSFHGKAIGLSSYEVTQLNAATCTNCHGVHDIKATNDITARVAGMDNLVRTCEQCHTGAGAEFAKGIPGHKEASPKNIPIAHYVEQFFNALLYSVVGFGAIVVVGAVVRFTGNRWRK